MSQPLTGQSGRYGYASQAGGINPPAGSAWSRLHNGGSRVERKRSMSKAEQKGFGSPDETRKLEKAKVELLQIGGGSVGRITLEPGWRWSTHLKPTVKTEWCEAPHFQYHVSGRLHVKMADGSECEVGPGEVSALPPGHDAWVVGNEPVVVVDWSGATNYGKK